MTVWSEEVANLKELVKEKSTGEIGKMYGVSKQRIFQVLTKYGIDTPHKRRKNFLKDLPPKYYWVNRMLGRYKTISKVERLELLETMSIPDYCPILSIKLNYDSDREDQGWTRQDDSPSVDRIDNSEGYIKSNIHIISWRANRIKNDGTAEEHRLIYEYLSKLK